MGQNGPNFPLRQSGIVLSTHGETLLALCEKAVAQVFLVAPFIKQDVLRRLLQAIPVEPEVTIVTRWIPEEVAHGVSDLAVLDLVTARPKARLLLHPCLHAKYYRVDSRCLVGSANLTAMALGWSQVPNIEILIEVPPEQHGLVALEETLLCQAMVATESIRRSVQLAAEEIQKRRLLTPEDIGRDSQGLTRSSAWLPTCVSPEYLYRIYSGADTSSLLTSAVNAGRYDLSSLAILPGLSEDDFRRYVMALLDQMPVVQEISTLSKNSAITTEAATSIVRKIMEGIPEPAYDAETYWLALKNWLLHFFSSRYRARAAVEVFEQARELS